MRRVIYIAHPVRGDVPGNRAKIVEICESLTSKNPEIFAWAPYLQSITHLDDTVVEDRALGIRINTACLRSGVVDELWLFGDTISEGMRAEIALARSLGIPVIAKTDGTARDLAALSDTP